MSPPLLGVGEGEGQSNVTLMASSTSLGSICQKGLQLQERNYMGLSDCSSVDSSSISCSSGGNNGCGLNLKATELRLGLPGSQSPERDTEPCPLGSTKLDEKILFCLHPANDSSYSVSQKIVVAGNKRGFSDAMDGFSEGKFLLSPGANAGAAKEASGAQPPKMKEATTQNTVAEKPCTVNKGASDRVGSGGPATKAQVVGWPPIRSFRKNTLASTSKNNEEVEGKAGSTALFVKVSMDGAPYLRKVDLRTYSAYQELSSALEKMFSCFTIGQYGSHGAQGKMLSESKLRDLLHGSEFVLTYEDKDGDWMLVGDVPWEMFINTCKRLRIMKGSDAIGLAPRAMEKCRSRN